MNKLINFKKITPVFILGIAAIIFLLSQFIVAGIDYIVYTYIVLFLIITIIIMLLDRFLVKKIKLFKVIIIEIVVIIIASIIYIFYAQELRLNVETNNPYFIVVFNNNGIASEDIPRKNILKKEININADSIVYVHKNLLYEIQIDPPKDWQYAYTSTKEATIINSDSVVVAIFMKEHNNEQLTSTLAKEIEKLKSKQ